MRRAPAEVRKIEPDPFYKSLVVSQVINKVLWRGKKGAARRIVYGSLDIVEQRTGGDPIQTLKKAMDNIRPTLEVRSRRVGGSSYQVPVEVRPRRAQTLAVRWLVEFARKRKEPTMAMRLANEILDAANRTGSAVKRREDVHKMAESNKAFAHYRW
jgi:small subunit ribosomal protein S7